MICWLWPDSVRAFHRTTLSASAIIQLYFIINKIIVFMIIFLLFLSSILLCSICWIGLNDLRAEGNFQWSDGSSFVYKNYSNNEPNDIHGQEDCIEINWWSNGWNDLNCGRTLCYVCKQTKSKLPTVCQLICKTYHILGWYIILFFTLRSHCNEKSIVRVKFQACTNLTASPYLKLNPLHPKIRMHILHTVLYKFPKVLIGRIYLKVKSLLFGDHFLYSRPVTMIFVSGVIF